FQSLLGISFEDIFVVDSYSDDETLDIARGFTDKVIEHKFDNYSNQRNWAQNNLPIKSEWVFHLDADERVTPKLAEELKRIFSNPDIKEDGFMVSRRTIFMDKWIRYGGHYPAYHLRLFKKNKGRCEERDYHQHFIVDGKVSILKNDILDIISSDLTSMIERHNKWISVEARIFVQNKAEGEVKGKLFGTPIERRRWQRACFYANMPLFVRPFLYFFYRYIIRLGFLDGARGLIFHFLQGLWGFFLLDAKIYEYRMKKGK
ncbi:MAG: glycosyltransferase family 2 protein, partial [Candidatus Omnitrophota bacterium]